MKKLILFLSFIVQLSFAQNLDDETLFTVAGKEVKVKDFVRVYTKNNINNQADFSKASLEDYLNLFVNFKLKVLEAENLKMDTIKSIQNELRTYQKQLAQNYINDKEVSEDLIKEAYERSKVEVDVSHILIRWPKEFPTSTDSLNTLKAIKNIKKQVTVANFNKVAKEKSQDPSAKENEGRLGFLTVLQTVYPFENAMYTTPVGSISEPVASQFGYHLVLVHATRPTRGKMRTAHLFIKSKETDNEEKQANAKKKIDEIYKELVSGAIDFDAAVQKYSEDSKTKFQNGLLPELSSGEMIPSFADVAFSLEKDGDFSEPVQTPIGWHIIKRISKTDIKDYEEASNELEKRVERDSRSNVAVEKSIEDTKQRFGFNTNAKNLNEVLDALAKSYSDEKYKIENQSLDKVIFKIGDKLFTQKDFIIYTKASFNKNPNLENINESLKAHYNKYQNSKLQEFREQHLAEISEDYKNLMQEYHDGILLFELTDQEVWSKAVIDTMGLRSFYNQNKMNYMWKERAEYSKYFFSNESSANKGIKLLSKGKDAEQVLSKLNKKEKLVSVKTYKVEEPALVDLGLEWKEGSNNTQVLEDGAISYLKVDRILSPEPKLLQETRGYVISDYQNYLEKQWIAALKAKYPLELNDKVFKSLIVE
ncbi:MAG: peptidylprolyl isomerase [Chitinophagales bacterium]|nr:peptidylprolyl isomerase [Chitinophagales bacterium]